MRNVTDRQTDRQSTENQNTHFVYSNYFRKSAVYEIMCKNTVESCRPQMTIRRMPFACCIPKATNTHSQYVVLIDFPLQQWLHERALTLRYTCAVSLLVSCPKETVFHSNIFSVTGQLLISVFHRAFFNSIIDKHQHMHFFTFKTVLV